MSSSTSTSEHAAHREARSRPRAVFFAVLAVATLLGSALATLASGFGSADAWPQLAFALRGRSQVVLFGNSVNRTRSHCDTDLRDLASMLEDELDRPVRDVSSGGMHIAEHLALARVLVRRGAAETLVLPVPAGTLDRPVPEDRKTVARVLAYTALARGPIAAAHAWLAPHPPRPATPARSPRDAQYAASRDAFMQAEKNAERCPEQSAADREFLRFMYRSRLGALSERPAAPSALASLAKEAREARVQLIVYLPPFPVDLLEREGLHAERAQLERHLDGLRRALAALDVPVVDLHATVPSEAFTDRWCACGHLSEVGRRRLAARLAAAAERTPAPLAPSAHDLAEARP